ncbi:MAG: T9SS type A sorting domain-containing protein [Bacteroidota bacterium]
MKKSLKHLLSFLFILLCKPIVYSQCYTPEQNNFSIPNNATFETKNGWYLSPHGTLRVLIVFAEVNYDVGTDPLPNGNASWQPHTLPTWANNFFDTQTPTGAAQGLVTRLFQQASKGDFNILGDYLLAPNNGGIFTVNQSALNPCTNQNCLNVSPLVTNINNVMLGNFVTGHGMNVSDFDLWTQTGEGLPKLSTPNTSCDHILFIFRNSQYNRTGFTKPYTVISNLVGTSAEGYTVVGEHPSPPWRVAAHEIAHDLIGSNNFHSGGGGGATNYWIAGESGWSILGGFNGSLRSFNGWDAYRLDWKGSNQFLIPARNSTNISELNGDLDPANTSQAGIYTLRDFISTGDAIRIKIPYTNPTTEYPEFLWIENHNGKAMSGSPYDVWNWEVEHPSCISPAPYGLYMQLQIDRELKSSNNTSTDLYGGYEDYMRPLTADGAWDRDFEGALVNNPCVRGGDVHAFIKTLPNPLSGTDDQDGHPFNINQSDNILDGGDSYQNEVEKIGINYYKNFFWGGHPRHVFTLAGNKKIGIATNPATASKVNLVSFISPLQGAHNVRKIYLNGISVEILNQDFVAGNIQVRVRFDDVDIDSDVRWCGDSIILNPIPTPNNISLNIKSGKSILLDQSLTASRMNNPQIFNTQQVFASNTLFQALSGSRINMEVNSSFVVDNNSILRLESGSRLDISNGAVLRIKRGGRLEMLGGATINILNGGKIIIEETPGSSSDGRLVYYPNARINLDGANSQLEIAGILDIQSNATFMPVSSTASTITFGSVKFSSVENPSQNVIAGSNSKFIMQSNIQSRKILYINQESLYGPSSLIEFSLKYGTAVMADNARIVSPQTNSCIINFTGALLTSPNNVRNNHRGLWLYGQSQITLLGSHFKNGFYGVHAFNTPFGNILNMTNCLYYNCNYGLFTLDKGVNATSTAFNECGIGWYAEGMSLTSSAKQCDATNNTVDGIYYQGVSVLNITDPYINTNKEGINALQVTTRINCGSVSSNTTNGIMLRGSATLFMDGSASSNHPPVTAVDNRTTVNCSKANNIYANLGYNDLRPVSSNSQSVFNGTFLCQTYGVQKAHFNHWNTNNSFSTGDYHILTSCANPVNVVFADNNPIAAVLCGQAIPPCEPQPCDPASRDFLEECSDCEQINTPDYTNEKLNEASKDAKETGEDDGLTDNELLAVDKYYQILMEPLSNINFNEDYILSYNYVRMKESFSDAITKNQIYPSKYPAPIDLYLGMMIEVHNKIITQADANGYYDLKYYVSLDKAGSYRMAGKLSDALAVLNDIMGWCDQSDYDYTSHIQCEVQIELNLSNNNISIEEAELQSENCVQMPMRLGSLSQFDKLITKQDADVFPNPASEVLNIRGFDEDLCTITIFNTLGSIVSTETFSKSLDIVIDDLEKGIYFYSIKNNFGREKSGKLIIN